MNPVTAIIDLVLEHDYTVNATITSLVSHRIKNGNLMTDVVIGDASGAVRCVWFSREKIEALILGSEYEFSGKYVHKYGRTALQMPSYRLLATSQNDYSPASLPWSAPTFPTRGTKRDWSGIIANLAVGAVYVVPLLFLLVNGGYSAWHERQMNAARTVICKDVTSIDHNWNNDVLCTNTDGTTFYTNYAGGNEYGYHFPGN